MTTATAKTRTVEVRLPANETFRNEVEKFLNASPAFHYQQTFDWINAQGWRSYRMFVTYDENRMAAVSFVEICKSRLPGLSSARVVRGPIYQRAGDLSIHIEELVQKLGKRFTTLRINPFRRAADDSLQLSNAWTLCDRPHFYSNTLVVPVLATEDEQWRTLRRSTRTAINRSRKYGVLVSTARSSLDYRAFARFYSSFATAQGIAPFDENLAARIQVQFDSKPPSRVLLLSAIKDQRTLGQTLLMRNADSLIYEWGWTTPRENRGNTPIMHQLIHAALNVCRREGYMELDLGGYWVDRGNDDPINHFKLGFTKQVRAYLPEYERTLSVTRTFLKRLIGQHSA